MIGSRVVLLPDGSALRLLERLGRGGEGVLWRTAQPDVVVKLLHSPHAAAPRVLRRCDVPSGRWKAAVGDHAWLRWPDRAVFDVESGSVVGYTIAAGADTAVALEWAQGRAARTVAGLDVSWQWLIRAALHLATACWWAEDAGYAATNLSGDCAVVDRRTALVTLADNDGVRDANADAGEMHAAITPPELLCRAGQDSATDAGALAAGRWALAVTVCRLLLEGEHPFLGRHPDYDGVADTTTWNVLNGHCRLTDGVGLGGLTHAVPIAVLPPRVIELAVRCFGPGADRPGLRPSAEAWARALAAADAELVGCRVRGARHRHHPATGACPWCAIDRGDPFAPLTSGRSS